MYDIYEIAKELLHESVEKIDYLGRGEYGEAYSLGEGVVIKITSSLKEFTAWKNFLRLQEEQKLSHIVRILDVRILKGKFCIIQEELETRGRLEHDFYVISDCDYNWEGSLIDNILLFNFEEADLPLSFEKTFCELQNIVWECKHQLGLENPDLRPENMGYSSEGVLKLFDIYRG